MEIDKLPSKGVYFLNTKQELKEWYSSNAKRYKTWKAIASIEDWLPVDADFLQQFRKELDDNGVDTRVIFKKEGLEHEPDGFKHRKVKVVPDKYRFRSSIDILDDQMLIMNPDLNVLGLVIESKVMLDIFNDMFDHMWDTIEDE